MPAAFAVCLNYTVNEIEASSFCTQRPITTTMMITEKKPQPQPQSTPTPTTAAANMFMDPSAFEAEDIEKELLDAGLEPEPTATSATTANSTSGVQQHGNEHEDPLLLLPGKEGGAPPSSGSSFGLSSGGIPGGRRSGRTSDDADSCTPQNACYEASLQNRLTGFRVCFAFSCIQTKCFRFYGMLVLSFACLKVQYRPPSHTRSPGSFRLVFGVLTLITTALTAVLGTQDNFPKQITHRL